MYVCLFLSLLFYHFMSKASSKTTQTSFDSREEIRRSIILCTNFSWTLLFQIYQWLVNMICFVMNYCREHYFCRWYCCIACVYYTRNRGALLSALCTAVCSILWFIDGRITHSRVRLLHNLGQNSYLIYTVFCVFQS